MGATTRSRGFAAASVALALAIAAGAAWAQAPLQECTAIDEPGARLACYDRIAGRTASDAGVTTAPDALPPAPKGPAGEPATGTATGDSASLLGERWALAPDSSGGRFGVRYHRANYVIARWSDNPGWQDTGNLPTSGESTGDEPKSTELKLQLSFKARLWETPDRAAAVWLGYTQQSHWQILDAGLSRPFRETNYMPELMLALRPDLEAGGVRWRLANIGFAHQSNGRGDPLSRSWNRVYAELGFETRDLALLIRPWYRIKEDAAKDDNPDITDYLGHGDVTAIYRVAGHTLTLTGRGNLRTGKGAGQFEWSTPPLLGPLRGYVQLFSGYGESLIDYNVRQTTFGVGVSLSDAL